MLKRILDFLDPMRTAEVVAQRYIWAAGMSGSMLISLVRLKGDLRVKFALPADPETGVVHPFAVSPGKLDEMIDFLQQCRDYNRSPS
ncbi:hypothetical protein [Bosea sp. UC22_33]|uniref:hypothetical protein n=1 Tax=Bosea sp. UC22_33 TaxID=3350165 RepID=UPI00366CB760